MYGTKTVTVSLNEVIAYNLEGFLDLLEARWMADEGPEVVGHLEDIAYQVVGHNTDDGTLNVSIHALPHYADEED